MPQCEARLSAREGRRCASGHRLLQILVELVEELLRGQPRLLVADQDREVLGHVAALHGVDADLFQSLVELLQLRLAVELAAIPETTGPAEDRRERGSEEPTSDHQT